MGAHPQTCSFCCLLFISALAALSITCTSLLHGSLKEILRTRNSFLKPRCFSVAFHTIAFTFLEALDETIAKRVRSIISLPRSSVAFHLIAFTFFQVFDETVDEGVYRIPSPLLAVPRSLPIPLRSHLLKRSTRQSVRVQDIVSLPLCSSVSDLSKNST